MKTAQKTETAGFDNGVHSRINSKGTVFHGIMPPTYFLAAVIVMPALHFILPVAEIISFPWNFSGLLPLVAGILLSIIGSNAFEKAGTAVRPLEESSVLVTRGVFRFSRNPMYLGFTLALLAIAVLLGTLSPFIPAVAYAVFMDVLFIRTEERMLAAKFGDEWTEYRMKTPRWI